MGFLLGLPLKLLALVFGLLRVLIPVLLLILVVRWLWRKQALGISKKRRTPLQGTGVYRGLQGSQGR